MHTYLHAHSQVSVIQDVQKDKETPCSYSIKVVNPLGKGGYELLTLKSQEVYVSIAPLKEAEHCVLLCIKTILKMTTTCNSVMLSLVMARRENIYQSYNVSNADVRDMI